MIKRKEKFITDKTGKKTAVVIPYRTYESILEDLHDLAIIAERKNEDTLSLSDLKKNLKKDGVL